MRTVWLLLEQHALTVRYAKFSRIMLPNGIQIPVLSTIIPVWEAPIAEGLKKALLLIEQNSVCYGQSAAIRNSK